MTSEQVLRTLYFSLVQSRIEYGIIFWGNAYHTHLNPIIIQQKHLVRLISRKGKFESSLPLFINKKILPLKYLFVYKVLKMFYSKSGNMIPNDNTYRNKLRNAEKFLLPRPNNTFFTKSYSFLAPKMFNLLPNNIKNVNRGNLFAAKLKKWLLSLEEIDYLFLIIK